MEWIIQIVVFLISAWVGYKLVTILGRRMLGRKVPKWTSADDLFTDEELDWVAQEWHQHPLWVGYQLAAWGYMRRWLKAHRSKEE